MRIYELVLKAMLAWPTDPNDGELPEERRARIEMTAESVAEAVDLAAMTGRWPAGRPRLELAAHTLSTIRYESGWLSLRVHTGEAVGDLDETAHDRRGSYCLMQINVGTGRPVHTLVGANQEATDRCVWTGVQMLAWARRQCAKRGWVSMASLHTSYTAGYRCRPSEDGIRRGRYALNLWREWRQDLEEEEEGASPVLQAKVEVPFMDLSWAKGIPAHEYVRLRTPSPHSTSEDRHVSRLLGGQWGSLRFYPGPGDWLEGLYGVRSGPQDAL